VAAPRFVLTVTLTVGLLAAPLGGEAQTPANLEPDQLRRQVG
jgi:hypothetical protein